MKFTRMVTILLALAVVAGAQRPNQKSPAASQFDELKTLAGEWNATVVENGKEMTASITFRVASGGSVLMSDLAAGMPHEMITMIHRDGGELLATHYCLTAISRGCAPWLAAHTTWWRSSSRTPRILPIRPRRTWEA